MPPRIPLVAIEEHNEAFFVWYYAREAGWLGPSDNILLHVDDHPDLNLPFSREPVPARNEIAGAASYTYERIDIANFIWPSVYSGVFSKVYWLRQKHNPDAGNWCRVKLMFSRERTPLPWSKTETFSLTPDPVNSGEVACEYAPLEPGDRLRPNAPLALDIDLDYFATNRPPVKPAFAYRLEESFAREMADNPYHWARVEVNSMKVERDPRGGWVMAPRENPFYARGTAQPQNGHSPQQIVAGALERFGNYLDEFRLQPSVITICRSDYSGYTPRALVREIEAGVRELLSRRFVIEEHSLNALLPEPWKIPRNLLRQWPW
jgi:hypothetical protein